MISPKILGASSYMIMKPFVQFIDVCSLLPCITSARVNTGLDKQKISAKHFLIHSF